MKIPKIKSKNLIILFSLIFLIILLLNTNAYAALYSPTSTLNVTLGNNNSTGYWVVGEGDSKNLTVWTDNTKVVKVWKSTFKTEVRINYQSLSVGTATIYVRTQNPSYEIGRKIVVNKPTVSTLKVDRGNGLTTQAQPLIVDFSATWKISSKYGWTVYSPNNGIIRVDKINHNNGTITFMALDSNISYIPGKPRINIHNNNRKLYWCMDKTLGSSKTICYKITIN